MLFFGKSKKPKTELEQILQAGFITKEEFLKLKRDRADKELAEYLKIKDKKKSFHWKK